MKINPLSLRERNRRLARELVLDAAEKLLQRNPDATYSMRELAAEAGVGFATPFNHFGSKTGIMQALSARLIARMAGRYQKRHVDGLDVLERVLVMGQIATELLLERPDVSKAIVGSLGTAGCGPSAVRARSSELWSLALGGYSGMDPRIGDAARSRLPEQLALLFRGCVSFWIAGELDDEQFRSSFEASARSLLLGYLDSRKRRALLEAMRE